MTSPMRYKGYLFFTGILVFFFFFSCSSYKKKKPVQTHRQVSEETLIRTNQYLVQKDEERIRQYIKRHGWHMKRTGTGLWYEIYHTGKGKKVTTGKSATIRYKIYLLDGSLIYSSDVSGPKTFPVGHGGVESGLEQGILLLRAGDEARLILPPRLAYGVPGDHNKIPPRSVIIYDLEVVNLK